MNTPVTTKDKSQALIITIGFHVLVLLIFLLIKYNIPAQYQTEEFGMEVNLGNSDDGFGDDQPEDPNPPSEQLASNSGAVSNLGNDDSKDIHTDDADDDRVAIKKPTAINTNATKINTEDKQKNKKKTDNNTQNNQNNTTPNQTSRFDVKGALNNANGNMAQNTKTGGSEGDGSGSGDKGKVGGNPNSKNYTGSGGNGTAGINHSFNNRKIRVYPSNKAEFQKAGTVHVQVRVDKAGNVTVLGTTGSTNPELNALAKEKAKQIKFTEAKAGDPIEQKGTIIIQFKLSK